MARRDSIAEARTQGTTFSTVPRKIDAASAHPSGSIVQDLFSITPPDGEGQGACKTRAFYIKGRLVQKSVSSKQFAELVDVPFENRSRSGALAARSFCTTWYQEAPLTSTPLQIFDTMRTRQHLRQK